MILTVIAGHFAPYAVKPREVVCEVIPFVVSPQAIEAPVALGASNAAFCCDIPG